VERAFWVRDAWAGGDYQNILKSRKGIYRDEQQAQASQDVVRTAFPLVGEQYKFKRILLGRETPSIAVQYVVRDIGTAAHLAAFILGFGMMWLLLYRMRDIRVLVVSVLVLCGVLFVSHYLLGMRRRLLWGADLAVISAIVHLRAAPITSRIKAWLHAPWTATRYLTFGNLFWVIGWLFLFSALLLFPLFVSSALFLVLLLMWRRARRLSREVRDA
jgi:hypothetical protein